MNEAGSLTKVARFFYVQPKAEEDFPEMKEGFFPKPVFFVLNRFSFSGTTLFPVGYLSYTSDLLPLR